LILVVSREIKAPLFEKMLPQLEPHWSVLKKVVEATEVDLDVTRWGQIEVPFSVPDKRKDQIVKHEPTKGKNQFMEAGAKGTHGTTKKIVMKSIETRQRLANIDDVI